MQHTASPDALSDPATTVEHDVPKRNDVSVKIDATVMDDCRLAAAFLNMTVAEYVSVRMKDASKRDIDDGIKRRTEGEAKGKPSRGK